MNTFSPQPYRDTPVSMHFLKNGHSKHDMSVHVIEWCKDKSTSQKKKYIKGLKQHNNQEKYCLNALEKNVSLQRRMYMTNTKILTLIDFSAKFYFLSNQGLPPKKTMSFVDK